MPFAVTSFNFQEIQPGSVEYRSTDDVLAKTMHIKRKNIVVPQHSHEFDHMTVIGQGSIRAWCDGELLGDFSYPASLIIKAGTKHKFLSLEDNTVLICIHNVARTGEIQVREEHQLSPADLSVGGDD